MPAGGQASIAASGSQAELSELATPYALIDARSMRRNIAEMQAAMAGIGAALRPHFKTHRAVAIARLQQDAGAIGLTVATVPQLAAGGPGLGCPRPVSRLPAIDAAGAPGLP